MLLGLLPTFPISFGSFAGLCVGAFALTSLLYSLCLELSLSLRLLSRFTFRLGTRPPILLGFLISLALRLGLLP